MSGTHRLVDLSQPFGAKTPLWPWPTMQDVIIQRVAFHERDQKQTTLITTKMHAATHVDAPIHVLPDGPSIDNMPLTSFYGTGVVVSIPTEKWEVITPKHLEAARPKIEAGDIVIINTGWHKKFGAANYEYFNHFGGLYKEAGEWLVEKQVKAVGVDQGAIDHPLAHIPLGTYAPWLDAEYRRETGRNPDDDFPLYEPCHKILYGNGIPGYENLGGDIDQVTGMRVTIAAFPIRYVDGDGSLVRAVAIVED